MARMKTKSKALRTFKPKARKVPDGLHQLEIERLAEDGRGVARSEGKTVFVSGGLPGEQVNVSYNACHKRYDEAKVVSVVEPSALRVAPPCEYFGRCGGCQLQHLDYSAQLKHKQAQLQALFSPLAHEFGNDKKSQAWTDPIVFNPLHYRHRARFAISANRGGLSVGFREAESHKLVDINSCPVVFPAINICLEQLKGLFRSLKARSQLSEMTITEDSNGRLGVALKSKKKLPLSDIDILRQHADQYGLHMTVNMVGEEEGAHKLGSEVSLRYSLKDFGIELPFALHDFTQVNPGVNTRLIECVLAWLEPEHHDIVADYFCGIGNFSLPVAKKVAAVVGVELMDSMVTKAAYSAESNGIANATFFCRDLMAPDVSVESGNKALLDPPRAGAEQLCHKLAASNLERIVYISCNPTTLLRDSKILLAGGYILEKLVLADMFPHTHHSEVIALFTMANS